MHPTISSKRIKYGLVLLCVLHIIFSAWYISQRDICADEPQYIEYAKRWLHNHPDRIIPLDDSKTPLTAIAWLPRMVQQFKHQDLKYNDWGKSDQKAGRYVMMIYTLLTALYIFGWSKKLLRGYWSLLPVALFLFDPLILGHSGIIGSDIASAWIYFALLFHLFSYIEQKKSKDFLLIAFYLGLACITKQNLVLLLLFIPLTVSIIHLQNKNVAPLFSKKNLMRIFYMLFLVCLVINMGFYFHGSFMSLGDYAFESASFNAWQQRLSFLHGVPIPFPKPFVLGYDMIRHHAEIGGGTELSTYNGVSVLGRTSMTHGFWYYYLAVGFFKMTLPFIIVFLLALIAFIKYSFQNKIRTDYIILIVPSICFFIALSCFNVFQIGIRHIIFLLPPAFILMSVFLQKLITQSPIFYFLLLWQLISTTFYFNNYISYTNELVCNKTEIIKCIPDASIDYNQNNSAAAVYVSMHSNFNLPSSKPMFGKFAVRAADVMHYNQSKPDTLAWLRNYQPVGNYKTTVWLYNIVDSLHH
jgi:hypothetical protein